MELELYCEDAECDRPQDGHGRFCARCTKRRQRKTNTSAPFAEKISQLERALNLVDQLSRCDPADDNEYRRIERALKSSCRVLGKDERKQAHSAAIKAGLAKRKAAGLPVGRPPKDESQISRVTRWRRRRLAQLFQKPEVLKQDTERSPGPRDT